MRTLFTSVGAYGHLIPLLPLALAARDAGQDVTVGTDARYHHLPQDAGLKTVAVGSSVSDAIRTAIIETPAGTKPDAAPAAFGRILPQRAVADLTSLFAESKPDLVVYEVLNPGAGIAAGLAGIPAVCHGIGRVSGGANWNAMRDIWLATAVEMGLELPADNPQFFGNAYVDICPPSLQLPGFGDSVDNRILMRPSGWNQAVEPPAFIRDRDSQRPLVYVTLGTAFSNADVLALVIKGLSVLDVDVLVATGRKLADGEFADLPTNVSVADWVPQRSVLAHADLVVSHGGSGTTLDTLAAGLPHLVIPQAADQFSNAQVVVDADLGRRILPGEVSACAVTTMARALLDDQELLSLVGKVALEIAAMPSPAEAAEQLAALTR